MSLTPIERILYEAIDLLDREGIPYGIMGGFAVRFWALPRPTYDGDLQISAAPERFVKALAQFEEAGFTVPDQYARGFTDTLAGMRKVKIQKYVDAKAWDIDIFVVTTELDRSAFQRRVCAKLDDRTLWFLSAEDIVLYKLIAGRQRDLADINDIIILQTDLDREYLRRWAQRLGLEDALEERFEETESLQ